MRLSQAPLADGRGKKAERDRVNVVNAALARIVWTVKENLGRPGGACAGGRYCGEDKQSNHKYRKYKL